MASYRLPSGKYTTNVKTLSRAWHKLAKPFEDLLDVHLAGFDPDIMLADHRSGRSISLPLWFAVPISEALENK